MQMSEFGFWAMLAFWGSAVGGIALAIAWARTRGHNPAPRDLVLESLKNRLQKGELSADEYARRISELKQKPGP